MTNQVTSTKPEVTLSNVINTWWPLAASWMLMGMELPLLSAIVARLAEPEINLAAYGGVVFPLALIIESPIIMLLAASTALSKDWASYRKVWQFMMATSALLTGLHILIAFTPAYYVIVEKIIGAPTEIIEPARIGLKIMLPWTWAIAYRRFNQGMLIRFGHSRVVSLGTLIRLVADLTVLLVGYKIGSLPGIVVATSGVAVGVTSEAFYVGLRIRPVIRNELKLAPSVDPPLTFRTFIAFYYPLAMTSLLGLIVQPIGSASVSRMPLALTSLAVWPVINGFLFLMRGMGIAFNEVVVSLLDKPASYKYLRKFTAILTVGTTCIIFLMSATPLAEIWFLRISALSQDLTILAKNGLWLGILMPGLAVLQSWYQGAILSGRKTGGITEAVIIFILAISLILWSGVALNRFAGIYVAIVAYEIGMILQTLWLWYRSRPAFQAFIRRDSQLDGISIGAVD